MKLLPMVCTAITLMTTISHSQLNADDASAKLNYQLFCQGCHTPSGEGGSGVPPLLNSVGHFLKTAEGRAYLMQVPGTAYSVLDDAKLSEVVNWVIKRYAGHSMPKAWVPYTAEETARYRATPLAQIAERRNRAFINGINSQ